MHVGCRTRLYQTLGLLTSVHYVKLKMGNNREKEKKDYINEGITETIRRHLNHVVQ